MHTLDLLQNEPFLAGLLAGLLVASVIWVRGKLAVSAERTEMARLKDLLHTKLELEARSHKALHEELESLRQQNENLRVTVKNLQHKPERNELRLLHVYDKAIRTLLSRSPGFGPAWQSVLDEAEREMAETEKGLGAFVRRVLSPRTSVQALPNPVDTQGEPSDD